MTPTELKVKFVQEMQNVDVSEEIYDYLESKYLHGIHINLIKEIAFDSITLGTQEPEDLIDLFNNHLLNIQIP